MNEKYKFQYFPPSGSIPGKEFEEQTEKAINEVGTFADEAKETAEKALDAANKTYDEVGGMAKEALENANNAQQDATKAIEAIDKTNTEVGKVNQEITNIKEDITQVNTDVRNVKDSADRADQTSNDNSQKIEELEISVDQVKTIADKAGGDANAAINMVSSLSALSHYEQVDESVNLDTYTSLLRLYLTNTSSENIPVAHEGLLDVDFTNDNDGDSRDITVIQRFLSIVDYSLYLRTGISTYDEDSESRTTSWTPWKENRPPESSGGSSAETPGLKVTGAAAGSTAGVTVTNPLANSIAIGAGAKVGTEGTGIAIGNGATVEIMDNFRDPVIASAFGNQTYVNVGGSVALGDRSRVVYGTPAGRTGVVSFGSGDTSYFPARRTLVNVGEGEQNTDAPNMSQIPKFWTSGLIDFDLKTTVLATHNVPINAINLPVFNCYLYCITDDINTGMKAGNFVPFGTSTGVDVAATSTVMVQKDVVYISIGATIYIRVPYTTAALVVGSSNIGRFAIIFTAIYNIWKPSE